MNHKLLDKIQQWYPIATGIVIFTCALGLSEMIRAHQKYQFAERLTAISQSALDKVMDKVNFYSDVVFHKSRSLDEYASLAENEWVTDSIFHIRHCTGMQTFILMDTLFNLRWIAHQEGQMNVPNLDFALMSKAAETRGKVWTLSDDGKSLWVFVPTYRRMNLIGYTLGAINLQKTISAVMSNEKNPEILSAFFANDKKIFTNKKMFEKSDDQWLQRRVINTHGISWKLNAWPTENLMEAYCNDHIALAILLFGALTAVLSTLLLRHLRQKSVYLEMLDRANLSLEKEVSEKARINDELRKLSRVAEQSPSSIIITNTAGNIEYVNPKFTQLSGYKLEEIIGRNPRILRSGKTGATEYEELWKTITSGGEWHGEFKNRKSNGDCYWGSASIAPIKDSQGKITHFISSMEDITERKEAEDRLRSSLLEKEVLMREINHRAKNNMQIISSLIKMQSRDSVEPRFASLLQNLGNRIAAMNIVHDQIFQSNDLNRIEAGRYISNLTRNIMSSFGENGGRIQLKVETNEVSLDVETGVHCGLIVNELVSNALKHAFAPGETGVIAVALRHAGNANLELTVSDNGVGMKEEINFRMVKSLGMRLVATLAENQLHGKIELNINPGTQFKILFPVQNERIM